MVKLKSKLEEVLENLLESFGLETILEQNDITELEVMEILYQGGLIDLEDYFYEDIDEIEEDIEDEETTKVIDLFTYWDEDN